jgi:hypothetical protein
MYIRRLHFGPESETLEMKSSNLLLQMLSVIQTYVQVWKPPVQQEHENS